MNILLPQLLFNGKLQIQSIYKPAIHLGGDALGCHELNDHTLALYILDVCAQGSEAAALANSVAKVLKNQNLSSIDFMQPHQVLKALNQAFPMHEQGSMFFSLWYGVYDTKKNLLTYASGGHPPAIHITAQGAIQWLTTSGFMIGGLRNSHYKSQTISMLAQDNLYIFSDGVYEIQNHLTKPWWSIEQLAQVLREAILQKKSALKNIWAYTQYLQNQKPLADDYTLLELKVLN